MREIVLRQFFEGVASEQQLASDVSGSLERGNETRVCIERMNSEFHVEPTHLVRVCDAVLSGVLEPSSLAVIGFALQASDVFVWDGSTEGGERVAETSADWSAPEISFPLTVEDVRGWRTYLTNGSREGLDPGLAG
jgi:hypothetical protein